MLAVFIGVTPALIFDSAGFAGGVAGKRIGAVRVTAIGGLGGLVMLLLILSLFPSVWSTGAVLLGAITGITGNTGAFGVVLLDACLAIRPMSILSPLMAVISAVVPALARVLRERIAPAQIIGLALALVAAALLALGQAPPW